MHVNIRAGDRQAKCGQIIDPTKPWNTGDNWIPSIIKPINRATDMQERPVIVGKCLKCGKISKVVLATDDNIYTYKQLPETLN